MDKKKLLLWDIDGTLVWVDRSGRDALNEAMKKEFAVERAMDGVSLGGCTDRGICLELFRKFDIPYSEESEARLFRSYLASLSLFLKNGIGNALVGAQEILQELHDCPRHVNALLTGNIEGGAKAKLVQFGLWDYFVFGAYGHFSEHRNALGGLALSIAQEVLGEPFTPAQTVIIGDTTKDIACARAMGASVIAVVTGAHSREELSAAAPDALLDNLHDKDQFLATLSTLGNG